MMTITYDTTPMTHAFFSLATVVGTMVLTWAALALVFHAIDRLEAALRRFADWRRRQRARRRVTQEEGQ